MWIYVHVWIYVGVLAKPSIVCAQILDNYIEDNCTLKITVHERQRSCLHQWEWVDLFELLATPCMVSTECLTPIKRSPGGITSPMCLIGQLQLWGHETPKSWIWLASRDYLNFSTAGLAGTNEQTHSTHKWLSKSLPWHFVTEPRIEALAAAA